MKMRDIKIFSYFGQDNTFKNSYYLIYFVPNVSLLVFLIIQDAISRLKLYSWSVIGVPFSRTSEGKTKYPVELRPHTPSS